MTRSEYDSIFVDLSVSMKQAARAVDPTVTAHALALIDHAASEAAHTLAVLSSRDPGSPTTPSMSSIFVQGQLWDAAQALQVTDPTHSARRCTVVDLLAGRTPS